MSPLVGECCKSVHCILYENYKLIAVLILNVSWLTRSWKTIHAKTIQWYPKRATKWILSADRNTIGSQAFKWLDNIATKCYLSERLHVSTRSKQYSKQRFCWWDVVCMCPDSTGISLLEPSKICRDGFLLNR